MHLFKKKILAIIWSWAYPEQSLCLEKWRNIHRYAPDEKINSLWGSNFTSGVGVLTAGPSEPAKYNTRVSLPLLNQPPASEKSTANKKRYFVVYYTHTTLVFSIHTDKEMCIFTYNYLPFNFF